MSRIRGNGNKTTEADVIKLFRKSGIKGWRRKQIISFSEGLANPCQASDGTIFKPTVHPDFVFPKLKIVLFIDGCFWHGCPKCYRKPKSRGLFWDAKFRRNRERDRFQTVALRRNGWRVIRIWECALKAEIFERLVKQIIPK